MSELSLDLQRRLSPILRAGDIAGCERSVAAQLGTLPESPFHLALGLSVTNDPRAVAAALDRFFHQEGAYVQIAAAYAELNDFVASPDLWFCNTFAYAQYGGSDNYDWLGDRQSEDWDTVTVEGLEPLQNIYASPSVRDKRFADARDVAGLLVVIKFQDLIRRAVPHMREMRFPIVATAQNYDFIYEVRRSD